jgi:hypothetical protein
MATAFSSPTNCSSSAVFIPPAEREADRLEAEIAEIWGHLNAVTFRFLQLLAEFDRAEGWVRHGVANCAQWLNLKCGIGTVAAREKVRVARALESLPAICEAFRHGQLSYSKVRAMTRVATPATEETLLNVALYGTASHIERLVRHFRRVERLEEAEQALARQRARFLNFGYDEDGSVTLQARFAPEVGRLIKRAIEAAMPDDDTGSAAPAAKVSAATAEYSEANVRDPIGAKRADALERIAGQFLADGAKNAGTDDRYQVAVHIDQTLLTEAGDHSPKCGAGLAGRSELEDGPELALATARRLACDSHLVGIVEDKRGEPLNVGRRTRAITPALKRALKSRDGGCRFPGCDRSRFTAGHHIRHWADGGETSLANLVTLCGFHHRLLHEGGFGLKTTDDGAFVFTRPNGLRIKPGEYARHHSSSSTHPTLPASADDASAKNCFRGIISELNKQWGITVRPPPGWHGERMDYGLAVEVLYIKRQQERQWERQVGMS